MARGESRANASPASEPRSLTTSLGRGAAAGESSLSSPPDADAAGVLLLLALPPLSLPPLLPPLLPLPPEPPMPGGELLPLPPDVRRAARVPPQRRLATRRRWRQRLGPGSVRLEWPATSR